MTIIFRRFLALSIFALQLSCGQVDKENNDVQEFPFTDVNWRIMDKEGKSQPMDTTIYDNKKALHLPVGHAAYLKNQEFKNFIIEFDVVGFVMPGLGFRLEDKDNYELIYLRANSSNKRDALQYIPIDNGNLPWQLYNYPKYEAEAEFASKKVTSFPLSFEEYLNAGIISDSLLLKLEEKNIVFSKEAQVQPIDEKTWGVGDIGKLMGLEFRKTASNWDVWNPYVWSHVKVVVYDDQAFVYVEDMSIPKLEVKNLKRKARIGGISLKNQFFDAFFTDVSITELEELEELQELQGIERNSSKEMPLTNYLTKWEVSEMFAKDSLNFVSQIDSLFLNKAVFESIEADDDGLLNISRFYDDMTKTVALSCNLISKVDKTVKLNFDYADHLVMFLNSEILFDKGVNFTPPAGKGEEGRVFVEDESVELNLKKGKNQLIFMLSGDNRQKFNWGFISKLETIDGISLK